MTTEPTSPPEPPPPPPEPPAQPDPNLPHYGYSNEKERLLSPSPDPGPDDLGEKLKAEQRVPEGSLEKERERVRLDPVTGETILPASGQRAQEASLEAIRRSGAGGLEPEEGGVSQADKVDLRMQEQDPAMLGVGRTIAEEPVMLVRAADVPEGWSSTDPGKRWGQTAYGGPGRGAPPAIPAEPGQRHHQGAAWPAPMSTAASAPSPSPEPGPEPSQQWHEPQNIVFADHDAAVRGIDGSRIEEQREAAKAALEAGSMPGRTEGEPAGERVNATGWETSGGPDDEAQQIASRNYRPSTVTPTPEEPEYDPTKPIPVERTQA